MPSAPVTSWRDSASPRAQDDFDALFNVPLTAAKNFLVKSGGFFSFGVEIGDDQLAMFAADPHSANVRRRARL